MLSCKSLLANVTLNGLLSQVRLVSYDSHGVFSSPRALYMFRTFGHHRSSILDGGLPGWLSHGGTTQHEQPKYMRVKYATPTLDERAVKSKDNVPSG